jgi:hypothetical protein
LTGPITDPTPTSRRGLNAMANPQKVVLAIEVNMRKKMKLPLVYRAILTVQTAIQMRIDVDCKMRESFSGGGSD